MIIDCRSCDTGFEATENGEFAGTLYRGRCPNPDCGCEMEVQTWNLR